MYKILIFFILIISGNTLSDNILVNVTGVTKVGEECFLSIEIEDQSKTKIENVDLSIYSLDENNSLIGKSEIGLKKIRKKQPYKTFTPITMNSVELCKNIKKTDLVVKECQLINGTSYKNCSNLFEIDKKESTTSIIEVNFSNNSNYYLNTKREDFFIPELGVRLKVLDIKTAQYYNIENYKNGLVVINNSNSILKEGDLIIEAEMNSIFKVQDLNEKIEDLKTNNKKSILLSLVREKEEKLFAVFLRK